MWPHHFDLATLISLQGETTVGVGFSPGDGSYPEPYWYVSPWPYPENTPEWPLESGGRWHTQGFTAAVLTGSDALQSADQEEAAEAFLRSAIAGSRRLLGV